MSLPVEHWYVSSNTDTISGRQHIIKPSQQVSSLSSSLRLRLVLSSSSHCVAGHPANMLISWMKCFAEEMSGALAVVWLPGREVKGWQWAYWTFSLSPLSKCHIGTISLGSTGGRLMWWTSGEASSSSLIDPVTPKMLLKTELVWDLWG